MRIHSYVVEHDMGFAPNPFWGNCTLANCKPKIRKYAKVGDLIVGTGSAKYNRQGFLVYWMYVNEIVDFENYHSTPRFYVKKPVLNGSVAQRYGDNIYFYEDGKIAQLDSFHSEEEGVSIPNLKRDTSTTDKVLIAKEFLYLGKSAVKIPEQFLSFVVKGQGHKNNFEDGAIEGFASWLFEFENRGLVDIPLGW